MPSSYPGALDTTARFRQDLQDDTAADTGVDTGQGTSVGFLPTLLRDLGSAVMAMQGVFGTNPHGSFPTVKDRLNAKIPDGSAVWAVVQADGVTDNTAAIQAALSAKISATGTGRVGLAPVGTGKVLHAGGIIVPAGIMLDLNGCQLKQTAAGIGIEVTDTGAPDFKNRRAEVCNGVLLGTSTVNGQIAVEVNDSYGSRLRKIRIGSGPTAADRFSGTGSVGVRLHNDQAWCEGTCLDDVHLIYCATGLLFKRTNTGSQGNSFAYQDHRKVSINVSANQVGVDIASVGGTVSGTPADVLLYNGFYRWTIWLEGDNAIGIDVGVNAKMPGDSFAHIQGESFGGTGRKFRVTRAANSQMVPEGIVSCWCDTSTTLEHNGTTAAVFAGARVKPLQVGISSDNAGLPVIQVRQSVNPSIATGVETALTYSLSDHRNPSVAGLWSSSTNPERLIAPWPGRWMLSGQIEWATNATGRRWLRVRRNPTVATGVVSGGTQVDADYAPVSDAANGTKQRVSREFTMAAGDYVVVSAQQDSGGALGITASPEHSFEFVWRYVGP